MGETARPQLWRKRGERAISAGRSHGSILTLVKKRNTLHTQTGWLLYRSTSTNTKPKGVRQDLCPPIHVSHEAISQRGRSNSNPTPSHFMTESRGGCGVFCNISYLPSCGTRFREAQDGSARRSMLISISPSPRRERRETSRVASGGQSGSCRRLSWSMVTPWSGRARW